MTEDTIMESGKGNVDVQVGGPGNNWIYLSACASMTGPDEGFGGTENRWCQDPEDGEGFAISSIIRGAPDQISFDLMTKLSKVNHLRDLDCPFGMRARYTICGGPREDPMNYDPLMLTYSPSYLQSRSYSDLVVTDPDDSDEVEVTTPVQAPYGYRVEKMVSLTRMGTAASLGDTPINDIEICDVKSCGGVCRTRSDGCSTGYAVTDTDVSLYPNPMLIKFVKNQTTQAYTWTRTPILGIENDVEAIECVGDRLIVSSNGSSVVAYNDEDGDQDAWQVIALGNAPSIYHNGLFARTAREIWVAAANGYLYVSYDGGLSYTAILEGEVTTQDLYCVHAYNKDLIYVGGANGTLLRSRNGGRTWVDLTDHTVTAASILVVRVPPRRPREVYIGTNNGLVFRSLTEGTSLTAVTFASDGVGTIDDLEFVGPFEGEVMFILHNDAGPRARILRDLSGGAGGADVEIVYDWTQIFQNGIELNALAPCGDVNYILAGGELDDDWPVIIEAS
jgi:hypothetical protein